MRFDGLYFSEPRDNGDKPKTFSRTYLRFYKDGCVVEQSVMEPSTVAQVSKWLSRDNTGTPIGRFVESGANVAFHTILEFGSDHPGEPSYGSVREDFDGEVFADKLVLTRTTQSGRVSKDCVFEFGATKSLK